jgi:hypothetical protein
MSFQEKYLKYKNKYLSLKNKSNFNQSGGTIPVGTIVGFEHFQIGSDGIMKQNSNNFIIEKSEDGLRNVSRNVPIKSKDELYSLIIVLNKKINK